MLLLPLTLFEWSKDNIIELQNEYLKCLESGKDERYPNMFQHTYIHDKPVKTPHYHKNILAIDFGGSSLKLGLYNVIDFNIIEEIEPEHIRIPNAENIEDVDAFEWIVDRIAKYIPDKKKEIIAGLTFSYPVKQTAINSGETLNLAKNFRFKPISGQIDPVIELNKVLKARGYNIIVKALSNDTVTTLMSFQGAKDDHRIAVVFGTGTNASCFKFDSILEACNLEWGTFEPAELLKNKYDKKYENILKKKGDKTNVFDRLIGGYGFLPLLNMVMKDIDSTKTELTLEDVNNEISKADENSSVFLAIKAIKLRSMKIIIAMIFAIIKSKKIKQHETVTLILNGSVFDHSFDHELFLSEISANLDLIGLRPDQIRSRKPKNASLVGMVNILMQEIL